MNPWDGSAANAAVAKIILEKQGMTVKLTDIDENAVWPALDSGTIDANLEVWPSGHAKDIDTYITTKKSVVDGGLIGPTGHIGWFIPKFVADEHPEYTSWEGLKTEAAAKYFATAETGDQGQFLLGDPSYVSYDADIIKNLDLPFKVVTGGGEAALITGIDTAFKDKTPLLFYFYNAAVGEREVRPRQGEAARRSPPSAPRRPRVRARTGSTRATTRPTTC